MRREEKPWTGAVLREVAERAGVDPGGQPEERSGGGEAGKGLRPSLRGHGGKGDRSGAWAKGENRAGRSDGAEEEGVDCVKVFLVEGGMLWYNESRRGRTLVSLCSFEKFTESLKMR